MDIDRFYQAVENNDDREISRFADYFIPRISDYLQAVCGAPRHLANEAATQTFNDITQKLFTSDANISKDLLNYMLISARNDYVRISKRDQKYEAVENLSPESDTFQAPADQINNMIDEEKKRLLRICIKKLDHKSRYFILYVMKYPALSILEVAGKLNYSYDNARKKKSKIVLNLQKCIEELSSQ